MTPTLRFSLPGWAAIGLILLLGRTGLRLADRWLSDSLRVTFFDVGQGDSALIQFPGGRTWLVDGGGAFLERDVGRQILSELTARAVLTLDALVLSHPDSDHGEGLRPLLKHLRVGSFWFHPTDKPLLRELTALARLSGVPLKAVANPTSSYETGVRVNLVPVAGEKSNDRALVLQAARGNCSVLFLGDLERDGESRLLRQNPSWPPPTVLKVAHHGSLTSSTPALLHRWPARYAVISSGAQNQYGHPNAVVTERLRQFRATVLRTDFHGWIEFTFFSDSTFRCRSSQGDCGQGKCD